MTNRPFRLLRLLAIAAVLPFVAPAPTTAQEAGTHLIVQGLYGTHLGEGGDSQSLSLGVSLNRVDFLVSAERLHLPTEVRRYENGSSVTRRGTTKFISGEIRWAPLSFRRLSPYVLAGLGRGTSRPNVNEFFPTPVTNDAVLAFTGGGLRVAVSGGLSVIADMRFVLQLEDSEDGGVYLFGPVRGGLAWRF
jgi:hypothetical protein